MARSIHRLEIFFSGTANGTYPVIGNVLELGTRRDTGIGIAGFRIVYVSTHSTLILFH